MGEVARDPRVPSLRRLPLPALLNLKDHLDRCQRSLNEFLEVSQTRRDTYLFIWILQYFTNLIHEFIQNLHSRNVFIVYCLLLQ